MPALLALFLSLACGPDAAAPATSRSSVPPAGAVLLVDEHPLTADDLARIVADVELLYPGYAFIHARRLALTNDALPRLAARAREPEGWRRARAACEQAVNELDTLVPAQLEGRFLGLGLSLWSAARHQALGEWSEPIELPGRWVRVRLAERSGTERPREEFLRLALLEYPFVAGPQGVEEAIDHARLTVIDPGFGEAIPEIWKHRMRGSKP